MEPTTDTQRSDADGELVVQILQPEISELIAKRNFASLRRVVEDWTPADLGDLLSLLEKDERVILFRLLPKDNQIDVFEYLEWDAQYDLIKAMGDERFKDILNDMSPDDRTALLEELPASITKRLLQQLSPEERSVAKTLLGYPDESVGRLMTPDYLAVKKNWSVREALDYVREHGEDSETLNILYVVDDAGKLVDDLKIREFLLAPLDARVEDLSDGSFQCLNAFDDQEEAVETFKRYDRIALPVTDSEGALIGIVTVDDVLDVAEEEATEDFHKMGGVEALDVPYSRAPLFDMIKKRAGWLSVLFLGEALTTFVMTLFDDLTSKAIVLTVFLPLIISSGGNSGSQTATLVIRALSLGEIKLKDWRVVMTREMISGLTLGAILAIIGFGKIAGLHYAYGAYGDHWALIGATVGLTLVGIVLWGAVMGSLFPLILERLGFDPATSSAPFVATMVDVTGLVIYFSIAYAVLSGTLV